MGTKIGIVTMWDSQDNYGQVLQCYALQAYLIKQGCNAYLIKTIPDTLTSTSKIQKLKGLPRKILKKRFWSLLYFRYKLKKFNKKYGVVNRHFDDFRNEHIKSTTEIYSIEQLKTHCPLADIYIAGSDQVWGAPSELYFLGFVPNNKPKYSYAASFGSNPFTVEGCKKMSHYLSTFSEITVREDSGIKKCSQMGIEAKRIIDPTGLLTDREYLALTETRPKVKYILLYLLGNFTNVDLKDVYAFASKNNLEVKYIASQGRNDNYTKIFPSPTEWLELVANAEYVVTNSYHCCMFSMYFQRKFMALSLTGVFSKMNARMDTLFQQYQIPRVETLEKMKETVFDYNIITALLEKDRHDAECIIKKWINK